MPRYDRAQWAYYSCGFLAGWQIYRRLFLHRKQNLLLADRVYVVVQRHRWWSATDSLHEDVDHSSFRPVRLSKPAENSQARLGQSSFSHPPYPRRNRTQILHLIIIDSSEIPFPRNVFAFSLLFTTASLTISMYGIELDFPSLSWNVFDTESSDTFIFNNIPQRNSFF